MGKLDVTLLRYLEPQDLRVLTAIEMGMKNHELVPTPLIASIASLPSGGAHKITRQLSHNRLVSYETHKAHVGYRLTNRGYDYLALHVLTRKNAIYAFGNQIGVGKESDIYVVTNEDREEFALKVHRLGRTSFRQLKNKRDYHGKRNISSWLYLSRIAASREFAFMRLLHSNGFPVPKPIECNRHCVVMQLIPGFPLHQIEKLGDVEKVYDDLMKLILKLANFGLVHGDFNEFNLMISDAGDVTMIDFPQMIPTDHKDAKFYFDRDVNCVKEFFFRRFGFVAGKLPDFHNDVIEVSFLQSTRKGRSSRKLFDEIDFDVDLLVNHEKDDDVTDDESDDVTDEEGDDVSDGEGDDVTKEESYDVTEIEKDDVITGLKEKCKINDDVTQDDIKKKVVNDDDVINEDNLTNENGVTSDNTDITDDDVSKDDDDVTTSRSSKISNVEVKKRARKVVDKEAKKRKQRRLKRGETSLQTRNRRHLQQDIKGSLNFGF